MRYKKLKKDHFYLIQLIMAIKTIKTVLVFSCFITLFTHPYQSFSNSTFQNQTPAINSNQKTLNEIDSIKKRLQTLKSNISRLQETQFDHQLSVAQETISRQNSLLTGFGDIYTIISILIGLLAVGVPIYTYIFSIRPTQKVLKDIDKKMNAKIEEYLASYQYKQVDQAINNLLSGNDVTINSATMYLLSLLNQGQELPKDLTYKLIKILKSDELPVRFRSDLLLPFTKQKSEYGDELFKGYLFDKELQHYSISYYSKAGLKDYLKYIKKYIEDSDNRPYKFFTIVDTVSYYSEENFKILINSGQIIDIFSQEEIRTISSYFDSWPYNDSWRTTDKIKKIVSDSFLGEKIRSSN